MTNSKNNKNEKKSCQIVAKTDAKVLQETSTKDPPAQNFMQIALEEAKKAFKKGEVPIGAVIVCDGKILAKAHNMREKKQNALLHAEILCINKACKKNHSWRLENCEMFVTLEPCPMCAGAIANARLCRVTFASEEKTSCDHLCEKILQSTRLNHTCQIVHDKTFEKQSSALLTNFFKQKRNQI